MQEEYISTVIQDGKVTLFMRLLNNEEYEIAMLDYELNKENVDIEIEKVLFEIQEKAGLGQWLQDVEIGDVVLPLVFINDRGITMFSKFEGELTDLSIAKELDTIYNNILESIDGLEKENLVLYILLNSPIIQKADYALFQAGYEYLVPIKDLPGTFTAELFERENKFSDEDIHVLASFFKDYLSSDDDVPNDRFIEIRGKLKPRSNIDADSYLKWALLGGFVGAHKLMCGRKLQFVFYLLTFGLFGMSWMFDLIEIFLGISKDKRGAYIGPFGGLKNLVFIPIGIYIILMVGIFKFL